MSITIDEAIKELGLINHDGVIISSFAQYEALKLGIEALKFIASWNEKQLPQHRIRLPGETEE